MRPRCRFSPTLSVFPTAEAISVVPFGPRILSVTCANATRDANHTVTDDASTRRKIGPAKILGSVSRRSLSGLLNAIGTPVSCQLPQRDHRPTLPRVLQFQYQNASTRHKRKCFRSIVIYYREV